MGAPQKGKEYRVGSWCSHKKKRKEKKEKKNWERAYCFMMFKAPPANLPLSPDVFFIHSGRLGLVVVYSFRVGDSKSEFIDLFGDDWGGRGGKERG